MEEEGQRAAPRTLEQAIALIEPAAEALALAHKRGIAHRDIKPANLFLLGDPRGESCPVKLLDFGIAKVVQDAQKMGGAFTKTSGQVTSFTPAYGAPEQFSRTHGATGPWTDVFALALVLVECVTGRPPLDGDDFMQIAYASADKAVRPTPRTRGVSVSDAVEAVFLGALAVVPTERYRTAGEFWNALRVAIGLEPLRALGSAQGPGLVSTSRPSVVSSASVREPPGSGSASAPGAVQITAPPATAGQAGRPSPLGTGPAMTTPVGATRDPSSLLSTSTTHPRPGGAGRAPLYAVLAGCVVVGGIGAAWLVTRHGASVPPPPVVAPSASAIAAPAPPPGVRGWRAVLHGLRRRSSSGEAGAQREAFPVLHRYLRGDDRGVLEVQRQREMQARFEGE
jgi:serine/threonine protein kinase